MDWDDSESIAREDDSGTPGCFGVDWDVSEPRVSEDFDGTSSTGRFGVD